MSNYYFAVSIDTSVCLPLDQVVDKFGNEIPENHNYSKEDIASFIQNEILFGVHNAISDGNYTVNIDKDELSRAVNLFFHDNCRSKTKISGDNPEAK